jgi:hypothetical protein
MARAPISVVRLTRTNIVEIDPATDGAVLDDTDGNVVTNDGATIFMFFNDAGAPATVEVLVPAGVDQDLTVSPRTYVLDDQAIYLTGYFPIETYGSQLLVDVDVAGVQAAPFTFR